MLLLPENDQISIALGFPYPYYLNVQIIVN